MKALLARHTDLCNKALVVRAHNYTIKGNLTPLNPVIERELREHLKQTLNHLLDNAVKFTQEGEIVVPAQVKTNSGEVAVKDTGIGIEADKKED